MADTARRNKLVLIAAVVVFVVVIAVLTIWSIGSRDTVKVQDLTGSANIANLADECTKDINAEMLTAINRGLYTYVKAANDYNHQSTSSSYTSSVRAGSCQTQSLAAADTFSTSAIIDIPDAQQSWQIGFTWASTSVPDSTVIADMGTLSPASGGSVTCVSDDQLKYGDFHCQAVLNRITAQTVAALCPADGDTPGYMGWGGVQTNGTWSLDAASVASLQTTLSAVLTLQNQATDDPGQRIACVSIQSTDTAQVVHPNVDVVTSIPAQFITQDGTATEHQITLTVDMNFAQTITLDGEKID